MAYEVDKANKFYWCDTCDRPLDIKVPCPDCNK